MIFLNYYNYYYTLILTILKMFPSPFRLNGINIPTLKPFSNNSNIDTTELDLLLAHPKFNDLISNHIQVKFTKEFSILKNSIEMNINDKNTNIQEKIKLNELKEQLKSREIFLNDIFNNVNQTLKQNIELEKNIQIEIQKLNTLKRKNIDDNNVIKIRKLNSTQRQAFDNDSSETETDDEPIVISESVDDKDSDDDFVIPSNAPSNAPSNLTFTEVSSLFNQPLIMEGHDLWYDSVFIFYFRI